MGNPAVEAAIKGLSLVGIDIPPGCEGFIELLINAGEDALTAVPHIISVIEQIGGEIWSSVEQLVDGMEQYGPVGYIQHLIDQGFNAHVETINAIHTQKKNMLANHRTTLNTVQTQVQALFTGPQAYSGPAAIQAQTQFATLTSGTSSHLDLLEQSLAVDQKFFTDYQSANASAAEAEIVVLIIVGIILIGCLVGAAFTGGLSLAGLASAPIIFSSADCLILAALVGVFDAWAVGHAYMTNQTQIDQDMEQLFKDLQDFLNSQRTDTDTNPDPNKSNDPGTQPDPMPIPLDPKVQKRTDEEKCDVKDWASFTVMFGAGYVDRVKAEHPKYACFILKELRDIQTSRPGMMGGMYVVESDMLYGGADSGTTGESSLFRGGFFQLQWVHDHLNSVKDTELVGNDGLQGPDAELYNGTFVEFKNWNYSTLQKNVGDLNKQLTHDRDAFPPPPERVVHFVFNATLCGGKLPPNVVKWLNSQAPSVTYELWTPPISD